MKKLTLSIVALFLISSNAFAADGESATSPMGSILMLVVLFAVFWFILIRPQMKQNKEAKKMNEALTKGDEIMTKGGVIGRVEKLGDSIVELEVADNVIIKIQRNAVGSVLPKGTFKA